MLSYVLVISTPGSHSSTVHPHQQHPYLLQQQLLELRVSVLSFQPWWFFFGGLPFALLVLQCRVSLALFSFSKYIVRVDLLFGPMAPRLAASAVGWQPDNIPWPLVLVLTSAELCSTGPASPAWSRNLEFRLLSWHYHCNYGTRLTLHWWIKSKPSVLYEWLLWTIQLAGEAKRLSLA